MAITVAAGSVLTAAVYNSNVPMYLTQGSDQTITTAAAQSWNATGATLSLDAGSTWFIEYLLDVGGANVAGNNIRPTFALTGGSTMGRLFIVGPKAASATDGASLTDVAVAVRTPTITNSYGITSDTTIRNQIRMSMVVTSTTAGTFVPQFNTNSGTVILYTGSIMIAHRVN